MNYKFESFDAEIVGGKLKLPRHLLDSDEGEIIVFPSPYMVVRISDEAHFNDVLASTEKLPKNHRESILKLIHSKAISVSTTASACDAAVHLMRDIYKGLADFKGAEPVKVHVENCGEYIQITVAE